MSCKSIFVIRSLTSLFSPSVCEKTVNNKELDDFADFKQKNYLFLRKEKRCFLKHTNTEVHFECDNVAHLRSYLIIIYYIIYLIIFNNIKYFLFEKLNKQFLYSLWTNLTIKIWHVLKIFISFKDVHFYFKKYFLKIILGERFEHLHDGQ